MRLNPKLKSTGAEPFLASFPLVGCLPQAAWPERLLSERSGRCPALQQIKERGALPMIDRGDIRQAIDRCGNIWASLPGAGYGQFEHKADSLIAKIQRSGRNGQRLMYEQSHHGVISALVICIIVCLSWAVNHYRDNAITYKAARQKCQGLGWRTWQLLTLTCRCVVMLLRSMKIHEGVSWCNKKLKMMRKNGDVAAGRRRLRIKAMSVSAREATTASGVDNATSPDWQTPLNRIISPSERLITMQKQLEEPRSIFQ